MRSLLAAACFLFAAARVEAGELKRFANLLKSKPQAVLVCVYKEWNDTAVDWDREGTVVQSLKGKWKVGDRIHYYIAMEVGTKMTPGRFSSDIGRLTYLFLDEYSKDKVLLQTGESARYTDQLAELTAILLERD